MTACHHDDLVEVGAYRRLATGDLQARLGPDLLGKRRNEALDLVVADAVRRKVRAHEAHRALRVAAARDLDLDERATAQVALAQPAALAAFADDLLVHHLRARDIRVHAAQPLVMVGVRREVGRELAVLGTGARHPDFVVLIRIHLRRKRLQAVRAKRVHLVKVSFLGHVVAPMKKATPELTKSGGRVSVPRECRQSARA